MLSVALGLQALQLLHKLFVDLQIEGVMPNMGGIHTQQQQVCYPISKQAYAMNCFTVLYTAGKMKVIPMKKNCTHKSMYVLTEKKEKKIEYPCRPQF